MYAPCSFLYKIVLAISITASASSSIQSIVDEPTMDEVLDTKSIDELVNGVGGGDPAVLHKVAGMFIESGPEKVRAIRESLENGDALGVTQATHFLKGSAGTLGIRRVSADCATIEATDLATQGGELHNLIAMLEQHVSDGIEALEKLLLQHQRPSGPS